jgi:hypothetical protein
MSGTGHRTAMAACSHVGSGGIFDKDSMQVSQVAAKSSRIAEDLQVEPCMCQTRAEIAI